MKNGRRVLSRGAMWSAVLKISSIFSAGAEVDQLRIHCNKVRGDSGLKQSDSN